MRVLFGAAVVTTLAACATEEYRPLTLAELHQQRDWQNEPGAALHAALSETANAVATTKGRAATLAQLEAAGYACQYGEAHTDYPEPMAVCTRSFATRACQFDWQVALTSDPARPDGVATIEPGFTRDCVETADDWPVPVNSALDDQLAPPPKVTKTY